MRIVCLLAVCMFVGQVAMAAVVTDGLVSWWKFDESSGTTAADSVGSNIGTLTNGPAWTAATSGAASSGALDFDNVDDYVRIEDSASLDITGAITVEAWFKWEGTPTDWDTIAAKGDQGDKNHWWMYYRKGQFRFETGYGDRYALVAFQSATAVIGQWYHFAATYDSLTGLVKLYVNDVEEVTDLDYGSMATNNYAVTIGKASYTNNYYFDGIIDDVRIYNKALTADEVQQNYAAQSIPEPVTMALLGLGSLAMLGKSHHR